MSNCSKKCNEIKEKIHNISGLDDDIVYKWLLALEKIVDATVTMIEDYADLDEFKKYSGMFAKYFSEIGRDELRLVDYCYYNGVHEPSVYELEEI